MATETPMPAFAPVDKPLEAVELGLELAEPGVVGLDV
jgi:hypothetical protein